MSSGEEETRNQSADPFIVKGKRQYAVAGLRLGYPFYPVFVIFDNC